MYRELVSQFTEENEWMSIQPPCPENEIAAAENAAGYSFPKELRDLLTEMNGDRWLLWSAREIAEKTNRIREGFLPLFAEDFGMEAYRDRIERFLFFGGNGCGDYYCYRASEDGLIDEHSIYIWEHEDIGEACCWKKVTDSLAECITRYYRSEI